MTAATKRAAGRTATVERAKARVDSAVDSAAEANKQAAQRGAKAELDDALEMRTA